jgi:hypothetical protein
MPIDTDIERRVAKLLLNRAAHHEEVAAQWRRLFELLFSTAPTSLVPGEDIPDPSLPDAFSPRRSHLHR